MTHCKECRSHVGLHILIVETHYLDQVLKSCYLYRNIVALGGFTHNLHDEVTLGLSKREILVRRGGGWEGEEETHRERREGRRERQRERETELDSKKEVLLSQN